MHRFILFGTPDGPDIIVNVDHVVAVEQVEDDTQDGFDRNVCRLFLSTPIWTDDDGENGVDYVAVSGDLFSTHRTLNGPRGAND